MSAFFFTCMIIAMLAVLASFGIGIFGMVRGGEFAKKYGNRLMQARVWLQALALALFVLAIVTSNK
jgi:hypothetical protein